MELEEEVVYEEDMKILDYPAMESWEYAGMEMEEGCSLKVEMEAVVTLMVRSFL